MPVRFAAALSAVLLSGAAAVLPVQAAPNRQAPVQMAELVPVEPTVPPVMMYGVPTPDPEPPAPALPPPAAAAPAKGGPAELEDGWEGGAARDKDGKFAYCVIEGRYNSGHVLMVARSPRGEINLGIGIPGANLPRGEEWPVKIAVDGKLTRERVAIAPQPDMLVVPNGRDEELVNALMAGKELVVSSAADRIVFVLTGTKKVLTDLKTCAEKQGNVPPIKTSTGVRTSKLPPGLIDLLAAAGIRNPEPVSLDNVPKEQRPADVAWRYGPIVGGLRERVVEAGSKLDQLSQTFADTMKQRCEGAATVSLGPSETVGALTVRTGAVDCTLSQGTLHVALTFILSQNRLFTVVFHEAAEPDVAMADKVRDNIAQVLKQVAANPPQLEAAPGAAQSPGAAQPGAPAAPAPQAGAQQPAAAAPPTASPAPAAPPQPSTAARPIPQVKPARP